MNRIIGLLVLGLGFSLSNCGGNAELTQGSIEQTTWQLIKMPTKMPKETSFKIAFEAGTLVGKGPCNRYHATYYASEGTFSISGGIGRTQEDCPASGPLEKAYSLLVYLSKRKGRSVYESSGIRGNVSSKIS